MNWEQLQFWGFFAGLGLFLLGMSILEQGLRGLTSSRLKDFLRSQTRSPLRGVITGTLATALLQSSSLVGLITLAFVGVGVLELRNALGIIFGSNLGTTFTGWIVTAIGFKLSLEEFAQPILACGAMGTVFLKKDQRPYFYSNLILGLGLLLLGLGEMKNSFQVLHANVDIDFLRGYSGFAYLLIGAVFTAVIQSSSATMMILLSALHAGVIDLYAAAAMVIGADLGTTSTVLLGALKGSADKRRVAMSHFLFNLATDLLAFVILPVLLVFITSYLRVSDPLYSLVLFHSLFNLAGIIIFIPFVDFYIRFLCWLIKDRQQLERVCLHIHSVSAEITDTAITAVRKELYGLVITAIRLNLRCFKLAPDQVLSRSQLDKSVPGDDPQLDYEHRYSCLKRAAGELLVYTYAIQNENRDEGLAQKATELNHAIRNVVYAAKYIKDIRENLAQFRHSQSEVVQQHSDKFCQKILRLYIQIARLFDEQEMDLANESYIQLKHDIRASYEDIMQRWYQAIGSVELGNNDISSFINLNRLVYLSSSSLLEAISVLQGVAPAEELGKVDHLSTGRLT